MKIFQTTRFWNLLILVNLVLSCILLFGMYTDYQFENGRVNFIYPFTVSVLTIILLWRIYRSGWGNRSKKLIISLIPLVISLPYLLTMVICLIPFYTCGCVFGLEYFWNDKGTPVLLQSNISPNYMNTAEVYYSYAKGDGAVGGYLDVFVKYRFLPFVNRKVYEVYTPKSDNEFKNPLIRWVDNNKIEFKNTQIQILNIGIVQFQPPRNFSFFEYLFH